MKRPPGAMTWTEHREMLRQRDAAELLRQRERAREALHAALEEVWSGADFLDTDAVLDHLSDRGYRVVMT